LRTSQSVPSLRTMGANMRALMFIGILVGGWLVGGCTSYRPQPWSEIALLAHAKTKNDGAVRVSAAVLTEEQNKALFGASLVDVGMQPVWLRIENNDTVPYILFPHNVDPQAFSPLEAAYRSHYRFAPATNEEMDAYFVKRSIGKIVPPGATITGVIYTNLDLGIKEVVVTLVGPQRIKNVTFFLAPSGLHTHYAEVDFATLYRPDAMIAYADEQALRTALEQLPCCTTNKEGSAPGDPLNLVLIGEADEFVPAFIDRHWDMTEKIYTGSIWREIIAFVRGARYRYAPFSPLYFAGRQQDLALQKARETIHARNHLRLWLSPLRWADKPVWVGQVSRDIGVHWTTKTWNFLTHRIDPDVDDTRDFLVQSLLLSRRVTKLGYVRGHDATQRDTPRRNLTGDPYVTDGLRAVLVFSKEITPLLQLQTLPWEWPSSLMFDGTMPWRSAD
jgi:LssY-like putative type I secretion system component LssY